MIAELLRKAHAAAKAGRVEEAREAMAVVEPYVERNPELRLALSMLKALTGGPITAEVRREAFRFAGELTPEHIFDGTDLENYRLGDPPKIFGPQNAALARGDFEAAGRLFWEYFGRLSSNLPGAHHMRLRDGTVVPLWDGRPVETLVVVFYDGAGDALLLGRYIEPVRRLARRLVVAVARPLASLVRQSIAPDVEVIDLAAAPAVLAKADAYANPWLLPTQSGAGFGCAQWLRPAWQPRPGSGGKLRVGLAWAGSNAGSQHRNVPVEELRPLLELDGEWHSLQVGPLAAQCPAQVIDHAAQIRSYADTAELVAGLDLVIAPDCSVSNLAAAQGAPTWVLLPTQHDFRWSTPQWFPSARVFRQESPGAWRPVIERVRGELAA